MARMNPVLKMHKPEIKKQSSTIGNNTERWVSIFKSFHIPIYKVKKFHSGDAIVIHCPYCEGWLYFYTQAECWEYHWHQSMEHYGTNRLCSGFKKYGKSYIGLIRMMHNEKHRQDITISEAIYKIDLWLYDNGIAGRPLRPEQQQVRQEQQQLQQEQQRLQQEQQRLRQKRQRLRREQQQRAREAAERSAERSKQLEKLGQKTRCLLESGFTASANCIRNLPGQVDSIFKQTAGEGNDIILWFLRVLLIIVFWLGVFLLVFIACSGQ